MGCRNATPIWRRESALRTSNSAAAQPLQSAFDAWWADVQAAQQTAREIALEADPSLDDEGNEEKWRFAALEILSTPDSFEGQAAYLQYGEILFANEAAAGHLQLRPLPHLSAGASTRPART